MLVQALVTLVYAWLLADFISGVAHWLEDRVLVGPSRFSFLNRIRADNDLHHMKPTAMLSNSWWENMNTTAVIAWPLAGFLYLVGCPLVLWLAVLFTTFANLIHRFAHTPRRHLHPVVKALQFTGVFASFNQHAGHHYRRGRVIPKDEATIRFCTMSNFLNPVLDRARFFTALQRLVGKL